MSGQSIANDDSEYITETIGLREVEIPAHWDLKNVSDIFNIQKKSFDPSDVSEQSTVQLYSMPAYDENNEPLETIAGKVGSKKYIVPNDTILFPKLNIFLKRFWRVRHQHEEPAICSTEYWPLVSKNELSLDYYYYFFNSDLFMSNPKVSLASGTDSHRRVRQGSFERAQLPVPPIYEQCRIADILSTVDEQIQQTDEIIERTTKLSHGLMKKLLTTGVGTDVKTREEQIGPRPVDIAEGWEMEYFDDVVEMNPNDDIPDKDSFPYLPMDAVNEETRSIDYWERREAEDCTRVRFQSGDTVYARITPCTENGKIAFIEQPEGIAFGSTEFLVFRARKERVIPKYVYYLSNFPLFRAVTISLMEGSTGRQRVPSDIFESNIQIPVPPIEEQQKIVQVLDCVQKRSKQEREYKKQLKYLKRALMQDLLTGKVRVDTD